MVWWRGGTGNQKWTLALEQFTAGLTHESTVDDMVTGKTQEEFREGIFATSRSSRGRLWWRKSKEQVRPRQALSREGKGGTVPAQHTKIHTGMTQIQQRTTWTKMRRRNKDYREPSVPSYEIWTLFTSQPVKTSVGTDRNFSKNTNDIYKAAF